MLGRADSRNVVGPYLGAVGNGTLAPLLGANGDGLRSVSARVGPKVLGNVFSGLGGDGISIFGAHVMYAVHLCNNAWSSLHAAGA